MLMKITRQSRDVDSCGWDGWHILTVGEAGFSMLDLYARGKYGISIRTIRKFADKINDLDESGSLYPEAPISAIPRRFFRDIEEGDIADYLIEFKDHLIEFIKANKKCIHAGKILIDFHVSPKPIPEIYLQATEEVFRNAPESGIDEVVIVI